MPDFEGGFELPESHPTLATTGKFTILDWTEIVVTVNKLPVTQVIEVDVNRALNVGAGTCKITIADPDRTSYSIFQPQDEIEVWVQASDMVGRKIWGGFIDTLNFGISRGETLEVNGKEYTSRLMSQTYNGTLSGTLYTQMQDILATQDEFTYETIPATLNDNVEAEVKNDTMYNALKQICDQVNVMFFIDPETRDVNARRRAEVMNTPDVILEGSNMLRGSKVQRNSDFLTNEAIIVFDSTGSAPSTVSDAAAQTAWGKFSRVETAGNISNSTEATDFGNTVLSNRKEPAEAYEFETGLLAYTDPGEYILITAPTLGLDAAYQVISIGHRWTPGTGVISRATVGAQPINRNLYISDIAERLSILERKKYNT